MDEDLIEGVKRFVCRELAVRDKQLSLTTRLGEDLGLDGDDARDFLQNFGKEFHVDMSNFNFSHYFGPEAGFNPFILLYKLIYYPKSLRKNSITLNDLIVAAKTGRWKHKSVQEK